MDKYFYISREKEQKDTETLISMIKEDKWFDNQTIIVNCSPDYSSRLVQDINHSLSSINKNDLLEVIDMQMPYPNSSQVWCPKDKEFQLFDYYLKNWIRDNLFFNKFLFVDSGTLRGKNFSKVRMCVKQNLDTEYFKFASLYVQSSSIFKPDFYVEEFDKEKDGGLLFNWENPKNPNWDY